MVSEGVAEGKRVLSELTDIISSLNDGEIGELFTSQQVADFLATVLDPQKARDFPSIAEFFLAHKERATLLAVLRFLITKDYAIKGGSAEGKKGFVSPHYAQWYEDGVMMLEGPERFAGHIVLYQDGELKYAVAARDMGPGDSIGPEDLLFISMRDARSAVKAIPQEELADMEHPVRILRDMLAKRTEAESLYQRFFEQYGNLIQRSLQL